jgi:hypothetical protein
MQGHIASLDLVMRVESRTAPAMHEVGLVTGTGSLHGFTVSGSYSLFVINLDVAFLVLLVLPASIDD